MYYSDIFTENKSNTNVIWKTINEVLGSRRDKAKTSLPDNLHVLLNGAGCTLSDKNDIVTALSDYFVKIGPDLASKINSTTNNFNEYLPNPNTDSFLCPLLLSMKFKLFFVC